jgi:hypothetical protein
MDATRNHMVQITTKLSITTTQDAQAARQL